MFSNLIESSSHSSELKRRGSFLLFTTITYALLFALAGVVSINAYDARLNQQNLESLGMLALIELPETATEEPPSPTAERGGQEGESGNQRMAERQIAMSRTNQPDVVPEGLSSAPLKNPPIPNGKFRIGPQDRNPGGSGPGMESSSNEAGSVVKPVVDIEQPPPPEPKPIPRVIRKKIINSEAISLPKPPYPPIARRLNIQGMVSIQVLIDESGRVISAKAVSGNPMLVFEAQKAAYEARFSPTLVGDQPMKVSGVITYNFVLQ
jgi:TonB family protein